MLYLQCLESYLAPFHHPAILATLLLAVRGSARCSCLYAAVCARTRFDIAHEQVALVLEAGSQKLSNVQRTSVVCKGCERSSNHSGSLFVWCHALKFFSAGLATDCSGRAVTGLAANDQIQALSNRRGRFALDFVSLHWRAAEQRGCAKICCAE